MWDKMTLWDSLNIGALLAFAVWTSYLVMMFYGRVLAERDGRLVPRGLGRVFNGDDARERMRRAPHTPVDRLLDTVLAGIAEMPEVEWAEATCYEHTTPFFDDDPDYETV